MGIILKDLLICDLFNDTAKRSDYLMSNLWLMSDVLEREELLFPLATKQKVAGSIPDGVFGNSHEHYPSGRTMELGLTQALTEMSTRNISWG